MLQPGEIIHLHDGRACELGKELGRGGEGAVFEIRGQPDLVAKLYSKPISVSKQQKLVALIQHGGAKLSKAAAWPLSTIDTPRRGTVGFVMPNLSAFRPLHLLYSPTSRKQHFPEADWSFLVHTARNLAACFATIHEAGIVIGDVNENLAFVDPKSGIVRMVDCDSFQVSHNGTVYRCEVGVPNFTPPELHFSNAFTAHDRTPQHDAFGLAVLIFHLLFFGRHPYAGVPTSNEDLPIEKAIPGHHFAYRDDRRSTKLRPPPGSIPMVIAGNTIVSMFERAFAPSVVARPLPVDWFSALSELSGRMARCTADGAHVYSNHLSSCPWCAVEEKIGVFLFLSRVAAKAINASRFDLGRIWSVIEAIPPPKPVTLAGIAIPPVKAKPLPFGDRAAALLVPLLRAALVVGAVLGFLAYPSMFLLWFIGAAVIWHLLPSEALGEIRVRKMAAIKARSDLDAAFSEFEKVAGTKRFDEAKAKLNELRGRYQSLPATYQSNLTKLQNQVREAQLRHHLERFSIRSAQISGIGDSRKQQLASFGITSAADIDAKRIGGIRGFGPVLISALTDWRHKQASTFRFDPKKGIDPQDLAKLNRDTEAATRKIEAEIQAGAAQLQQIQREIEAHRRRLLPELEALALKEAQARADASPA